ncbi:uncharacterized protein LOC143252074 [Tachypleus tridentatus]|uniref:uncharacterized protein LOC143252074 n=1 Tax=Tachypleus tridentatus TaxID=6853 RepID=UPI003FD48893
MGCICSFFKALTSYHGMHLTPSQVERQRLQRARKPQPFPNRDSSCIGTLEKEHDWPGSGISSPHSPVRPKQWSEEDRLLTFSPQKQKLGDGERQSSFSQQKFKTPFSKPES